MLLTDEERRGCPDAARPAQRKAQRPRAAAAPPDSLGSRAASAREQQPPSFAPGDTVSVRFKLGAATKRYRGRVQEQLAPFSYTVLFDDGETHNCNPKIDDMLLVDSFRAPR